MKRKILNEIKQWAVLIFWTAFIVAFLYLLITVKEFALTH